ncbi:MAG: hypothetical protein GY940_00130 [bacterium]|nr:hypothetical protein [bacterium]
MKKGLLFYKINVKTKTDGVNHTASGNKIVPGSNLLPEFRLSAPLQSCIRGSRGNWKALKPSLSGSFCHHSLADEPDEHYAEGQPVIGAAGNPSLSLTCDGDDDDEPVNISVGGGD